MPEYFDEEDDGYEDEGDQVAAYEEPSLPEPTQAPEPSYGPPEIVQEGRSRARDSRRFELREGRDLGQSGGWEPLSHADYLRMQRMNQGLASLDQQLEDGEIPQEMFNDLRFELRNNLRPLTARAQHEQSQQREQQIIAMRNSNATIAATQQADAVFRARGLAERTVMEYDPQMLQEVVAEIPRDAFDSNEAHDAAVKREVARRGGAVRMLEVGPGRFQPLPFNPQGVSTIGQRASAGGGSRPLNEAQLGSIMERVIKSVDEQMIARPPNVAGGIDGPAGQEWRRNEIERRVQEQVDMTRRILNPPQPPPVLTGEQQALQLHRDARSVQTQFDAIARAHPELQREILALREALNVPRRTDWRGVGELLRRLPPDVIGGMQFPATFTQAVLAANAPIVPPVRPAIPPQAAVMPISAATRQDPRRIRQFSGRLE